MKKHLIYLTLAAFFAAGTALVQGCGGASEQDDAANGEQTAGYYCPMKCEGDKTYAEAGKCPECGMDLVTGEGMHEESGDGHDHEGHDHGHEDDTVQ